VLTLLALVPALALAQQKPIKVMQDGSLLGNGWWSGNGTYATLDCVAPVTCTRNAATGVVQITSSGGGGGAPTNATYITQTANASLSNEQALSSLSTGLVKVTTGTGVLSTASSGTDYAPATSGTALQLANGSGGFSGYAGTSCTNQFPRSLSTAGAATCATVALSTDTSGTLAIGRGGTGQTSITTNQLYVGTALDTLAAKTLPSCSNSTTSKLLFDNATQTFSCGTDQGGGANVAEVSIALSDTGFFQQVVTGQTWVTGTSKVVCSAFGTTADSLTPEAVAIGGLVPSVSDLVVGTGFTLNVYSPNGLTGTVRFHCTGA
jgi:hypothetical protein